MIRTHLQNFSPDVFINFLTILRPQLFFDISQSKLLISTFRFFKLNKLLNFFRSLGHLRAVVTHEADALGTRNTHSVPLNIWVSQIANLSEISVLNQCRTNTCFKLNKKITIVYICKITFFADKKYILGLKDEVKSQIRNVLLQIFQFLTHSLLACESK